MAIDVPAPHIMCGCLDLTFCGAPVRDMDRGGLWAPGDPVCAACMAKIADMVSLARSLGATEVLDVPCPLTGKLWGVCSSQAQPGV